MVEKDSAGAINFEKLDAIFPSGNSLLILFQGDFASKRNLCKVEKWIEDENLRNSDLKQISDPLRIRTVKNEETRLLYPLLVDLNCLNNLDDSSYLNKIEETPWKNIFTSGDQQSLVVEFMFNESKTVGKYGKIHPEVLAKIHNSLKESFKNTNINYALSGQLGFFYYAVKGLTVSNILNLVFLAVILILFRFFFGSWRSGVLFGGTLSLMGGILYGLIALTGHAMNFLNAGLFLMVAVATIEDFVFLSSEQIKAGTSSDELFKKLAIPSFFTSLTTMIGFGSLCFTDLRIIREFGLWAAVGSALEWAMLFYFLPCFLQLFPTWKIWTNAKQARFKNTFQTLATYNIPLKLLPLLLSVFIGAIYSVAHLESTDTPVKVFPQNNVLRQSVTDLKKIHGWEARFSIVFKDFDNKEINEQIMSKVRENALVSQVENPYDQFNYYTQNLAPTRQQLVLRNLSTTDFYKRLISMTNETRAVVYAKENDSNKIKALSAEIEELCLHGKYCYPAGEMIAYSEFSSKTISVLTDSLMISLILVSIILVGLTYLLKIGTKWIIVVSALWGPFCMLNIFYLFDIPLNSMTCTYAGILVGLTGDSAIYYMFESQGKNLEDGIRFRGNGSIEMVLIMFLCTFIFQFSYFASARTLGLLIGFGMVASLIGDLWILKALLQLKERFNQRRAK